jgi:hypothetical protein
VNDILTFEEAWPEIKAGKEFVAFLDYGQLGVKIDNLKRLMKCPLEEIAKMQFQIKREPREWAVYYNGEIFLTEKQAGEIHNIHWDDRMKKIKVREVIE